MGSTGVSKAVVRDEDAQLMLAFRAGASLEAELAALPDRQREALWLAGLSYAEVARVLETSEASVKALVHRARMTHEERMGRGKMES